MATKYYVAHNVHLARETKGDKSKATLGTPGAMGIANPPQILKADTVIDAGELTDEEIESLVALDAIREVTPAEDEAFQQKAAAAAAQQATTANAAEKQRLAREHAAQRAEIIRKHEDAKNEELAGLEEKQAEERRALDEDLAAQLNDANPADGEKKVARRRAKRAE